MSKEVKKTAIPSRVAVKRAIEIAQSHIPNAGRGLFAKEDIKDGELIFTIPRPHIIIANPKHKSEICDNCFAIRDPLSPTVPLSANNPKLLRCGVCKIVYYCNKECQTTAWKHHHKHECHAFVWLTGVTIDGFELLDLAGIMGLVRLKVLITNNPYSVNASLSREERAEFCALKTNREMLEKNCDFAAMMETETTLLIDNWTRPDTEYHRNELKDLYCALATNQLSVLLPVLRGSWHVNDPEHPSFIMAGTCLDPFVALLNHSCDANSVWAFDGVQLRVRAREDISAGDELTISYTNSGRDYHQRNQELLTNYGFTCTCVLCKKGFLDGSKATPTGDLREMLLGMIAAGNPETAADIREVSLAINSLQAEGFGLDKYPNRPLHQMALSGFLKLGDYNMALKTCLILFYFIEPYQTPLAQRAERLKTLSCLIQLLDPKQDDSSTHPLLPLRLHLHFHLRHKYVKEVEMCYGADSTAGIFEKESFETAVKGIEETAGPNPQSVSVQDKDRRAIFVVHMNQVLKMTDLPMKTEKELFWDG